jgi:hypothetical protein
VRWLGSLLCFLNQQLATNFEQLQLGKSETKSKARKQQKHCPAAFQLQNPLTRGDHSLSTATTKAISDGNSHPRLHNASPALRARWGRGALSKFSIFYPKMQRPQEQIWGHQAGHGPLCPGHDPSPVLPPGSGLFLGLAPSGAWKP